MSAIVNINETGILQLPDEVVQAISPHTRFQVEVADQSVAQLLANNHQLFITSQTIIEFWVSSESSP